MVILMFEIKHLQKCHTRLDLSLQYPQSVYTTVPFVVSENLVPQLPLPAVILHNVRSRSFWARSCCELHLDIKAVERLYSPSLLKPVCTNCSDESGLLGILHSPN